MQRPYASVPLETNLARKGLLALGRSTGPVDSTDILGTVRSTTALRLVDLDVVAWLSLRVERDSSSVVFSRDYLASDLFGRRPGGRERSMVDASLARLAGVRMTLGGFDAERREHRPDGAFVDVPGLEAVERISSARRHEGSWRAHLPQWLLTQLEYGYVTYLHWDTLRELRGLAKRLWIYFEAESRDEFYVGLSRPGLTSLCIRTERTADAHKAIRAALGEVSAAGCTLSAGVVTTRTGHRLRVHRYGEGTRNQLRLDRTPRAPAGPVPTRSDVPRPSQRLVGSRAPTYDRRDPDAYDRRQRQPLPEPLALFHVGSFPNDLTGLLQWIDRDAIRSNVVVLRSDSDYTMHSASCTTLLDHLVQGDVTGEFVMAQASSLVSAWCDRQRVPPPKRCEYCTWQ